MLDDCDLEERWRQVDDLITRWLRERQSLIVQFCGISGVHAFAPQKVNRNQRLERFCETLVDYVSAGHFEVYYELLREAESFRDGSSELARSVFPALHASTQTALEFHDRYEQGKLESNADLLARDLSRLGETLAARFELEDRLIAGMHSAHRDLVA